MAYPETLSFILLGDTACRVGGARAGLGLAQALAAGTLNPHPDSGSPCLGMLYHVSGRLISRRDDLGYYGWAEVGGCASLLICMLEIRRIGMSKKLTGTEFVG